MTESGITQNRDNMWKDQVQIRHINLDHNKIYTTQEHIHINGQYQ